MQLHQLHPTQLNKKKRTIGRGGKRGTFSGRGTKGQKARAGRRIRPAERDLIIRLPKLRGYHNKPKMEKLPVINVGDLAKSVTGTLINEATLGRRVKILGAGDVTKAFTIEALPVSASARVKIEKAGGTITAAVPKEKPAEKKKVSKKA